MALTPHNKYGSKFLILLLGVTFKSCGGFMSLGPPVGATTLAQLHKKKTAIYIVCFIAVNIDFNLGV